MIGFKDKDENRENTLMLMFYLPSLMPDINGMHVYPV